MPICGHYKALEYKHTQHWYKLQWYTTHPELGGLLIADGVGHGHQVRLPEAGKLGPRAVALWMMTSA
jgi:hypothetical protein